jgi:hypothetical protein
MANIYIADETRKNLDRASELDNRTLDGEINHLCQQRLKELGAVRDDSASSPQGNGNPTT